MTLDAFTLDPRLAADTSPVADWPLCRALLMEDARYPWLVLVPRRPGLVELADLPPEDRSVLIDEILRAGSAVKSLLPQAKLNIGALGNLVPQLHIHVIGRVPGDPAWPGPVWGHSPAFPYDNDGRAARLAALRGC
ncbi:MAG TPA: HIT family protein [Rhizomicrobium sp.]|jgi:diadenosine tetraphosphate (Ap4A) HIT family hydrolase|nr:HIT family protein [Rhizomicrobium sp.]